MKPIASLVSLSWLVMFSVAAHANPQIVREAKALDAASRQIIAPQEMIAAMRLHYDKIVAGIGRVGLSNLPNEDVEALFAASQTLTFYTSDAAATRQMRRALNELEHRHLATAKKRRTMLDAYVAARLLDEARAFADALPDQRDKLPAFRDSASTSPAPKLWRLSADGKTLTRHDHPLAETSELIVVSSPDCHFSQNAVADIATDPALAALMRAKSKWIIGQQRIADFAHVAAWNSDHPDAAMEIIYDNAQWPALSTWATPGFFFFRNGRLVYSFDGWPGKSQFDELRKGLALLDAN